MSKGSWYFLLNFILLCLLTSGCSTVVNAHRQKQEMVSSCLMGNPGAALEFAAKKVGKNDNNAVMWNLEAGALAFHSGNYDSSLEYFGQAESLMDDFDDRAVVSLRDMGAETGALFTNLNALPYQGLCRDRMMIPVFKSMAYLAGRKDDSFQAQVRRLRNHHDDVIAKYALNGICQARNVLYLNRSFCLFAKNYACYIVGTKCAYTTTIVSTLL